MKCLPLCNKTNQEGLGRLGSGSLPVRRANTFSNSLSTDASQHSANLPVQAEGYECSTSVSGGRENQTKMSQLVAYIIKLNRGEFLINILSVTHIAVAHSLNSAVFFFLIHSSSHKLLLLLLISLYCRLLNKNFHSFSGLKCVLYIYIYICIYILYMLWILSVLIIINREFVSVKN